MYALKTSINYSNKQHSTAGVPPLYFADGGVKDRTGIHDWSAWKTANESVTKGIVHLVGPSSLRLKTCPINTLMNWDWLLFNHERNKVDPSTTQSYRDDPSFTLPSHSRVFIVRTPSSKASFFDLKDFEDQVWTVNSTRSWQTFWSFYPCDVYICYAFQCRSKLRMLVLSKVFYRLNSKSFR